MKQTLLIIMAITFAVAFSSCARNFGVKGNTSTTNYAEVCDSEYVLRFHAPMDELYVEINHKGNKGNIGFTGDKSAKHKVYVDSDKNEYTIDGVTFIYKSDIDIYIK